MSQLDHSVVSRCRGVIAWSFVEYGCGDDGRTPERDIWEKVRELE